jgi:hypothetical protein
MAQIIHLRQVFPFPNNGTLSGKAFFGYNDLMLCFGPEIKKAT